MNIKKRLKQVESEICPKDVVYLLRIYNYVNSDPKGMGNMYMKDGKIIGWIKAIFEKSTSGKIIRSIDPSLKEGKKILFKLGYKIIDQGSNNGQAVYRPTRT